MHFGPLGADYTLVAGKKVTIHGVDGTLISSLEHDRKYVLFREHLTTQTSRHTHIALMLMYTTCTYVHVTTLGWERSSVRRMCCSRDQRRAVSRCGTSGPAPSAPCSTYPRRIPTGTVPPPCNVYRYWGEIDRLGLSLHHLTLSNPSTVLIHSRCRIRGIALPGLDSPSSSNPTHLATASSDGRIRLWDTRMASSSADSPSSGRQLDKYVGEALTNARLTSLVAVNNESCRAKYANQLASQLAIPLPDAEEGEAVAAGPQGKKERAAGKGASTSGRGEKATAATAVTGKGKAQVQAKQGQKGMKKEEEEHGFEEVAAGTCVCVVLRGSSLVRERETDVCFLHRFTSRCTHTQIKPGTRRRNMKTTRHRMRRGLRRRAGLIRGSVSRMRGRAYGDRGPRGERALQTSKRRGRDRRSTRRGCARWQRRRNATRRAKSDLVSQVRSGCAFRTALSSNF